MLNIISMDIDESQHGSTDGYHIVETYYEGYHLVFKEIGGRNHWCKLVQNQLVHIVWYLIDGNESYEQVMQSNSNLLWICNRMNPVPLIVVWKGNPLPTFQYPAGWKIGVFSGNEYNRLFQWTIENASY